MIIDDPQIEPPDENANTIPRRKIVYVDDVHFNLVSMKNRLKPYYEVFPIKSAEVLFGTLKNIDPEVILLDINMPDENGFEILKELKEDSRFAEIPVIFFTLSKDKATVKKGMELGAVDIIFKPAEDQEIIDRIEFQFDEERQKKNKPIVLAVDDNPSILKSINQVLHDKYEVYTLPKSEDIKETLRFLKPDLFLLDLHMPVMSGTDLVRIIREKIWFEDTPIVILTSDATSDSLYSVTSIGANDYIVKPIDEKILKSKLETHLKGFLMRRIANSLLY